MIARPARRATTLLRPLAAAALLAASLLAGAQPAAGNAAAPAFVEWRVLPGDTLIGIGRRLLVDPRQWPQVARENRVRNVDRIAPGTVLRIPQALVRSEAVPAQVLAVRGAVAAGDGGAAVQAGTALAEGAKLSAGADGNAVVRLVDGSVLRLRSGSELTLRESRRYPGFDQVRSSVRLEKGRVEVQSPRSPGGQPGFEVHTPQGVLGVRGTEFRVAADAAAQRSLGEVLEGAVAAEAARGTQLVKAGFGVVVNTDGSVPPPVPLLPAPDISALPVLQQRVLVRFDWPALAGASGYRAQVASDGEFATVVTDVELAALPLRVPGLPDGRYVLRLRARDAQGLEGRHADHAFTLKARPEAPLPGSPVPGARPVGRVEFRWAVNPEATLYWLQVARDAAFEQLVVNRRDLTGNTLVLSDLPPGNYHWRVTSLRTADDAGPFGDALQFELRPTPPAAPPPTSQVDDQGVRLAWPAQPGQQFDLQIARDAAFAQPLLSQRLTTPGFAFTPPGSGRFHVRLRTIEADGYVGPYGAAQFFEVPNCVRTGAGACVRASGEPVLTVP